MKKTGFTLLETLAGLALTSLLAFVIFDLFGQAENGKKGVYSAVDFNTLLLTIHSITTDEDYCGEAFRNQTNTTAAKHSASATHEQKLGAIYWTNRNQTPLNPLDGIRLAAVNENINKGLRIKSLELRTLSSRPSATPGKTIDIVELIIKAEKTSQTNQLGSALLSNEATPFRFAIQKDSTDGSVEKCLLETQSTPLVPVTDRIKDILSLRW